ncbi:MAG: tetratricopeptide repeat protein [Phycisphaeraceae bacterium]|nr:tetratricopeptide repeat protein [Phycisphaeraceae bacterium]
MISKCSSAHRFSIWVGAAIFLWLSLGLSAEVHAADPEESQYNVAAALVNAGQWQAAIKKIEEREKLDLSDTMRAKYLYAKAQAYEVGEKATESRGTYEQLLEKYPSSAEAAPTRIALIYLDYAAGRIDAVIERYGKVTTAQLSADDKKNLPLMYAECLYAKKPDKAALDAYHAAIAAGADASTLTAKLFDLYVRLGMHSELLAISAKPIASIKDDLLLLVRSESLLALNRYGEAETEAAKVPANSVYAPRASFVIAQARIKQNKLKEAVDPLQAAISGMKNPSAPPAAYLALAECLLESGRGNEVKKVLDAAAKAVADAPEDQQVKLRGQIDILLIRAASTDASGVKNRKALIDAITAARQTAPKDQLSKLLYMRLFALSEEGDHKAVLATMKDDYPILESGEEYGPATLIYVASLRKIGRGKEATKLLEDFIIQKPDSSEALRIKLELANDILEQGDNVKAKAEFDAISAAAGAQDKLGKSAFDELQFNRGVLAQKLNEHATAVTLFTTLLAGAPNEDITRATLPLLGQSYALQKDYTNAAATWKRSLSLPNLKTGDEADLRDRLARVLFAMNQYAEASSEFAAEAKLLNGETKLTRESLELWARSLYSQQKYAEAASMYAELADNYRDTPGYAYEAAVAYERDKKFSDAEKWFTRAATQKSKLPEPYASQVDAQLAALRLSSGTGDMGLADWLSRIGSAKDDADFEAAAGSLRKIAAAGKIDAAGRDRLTKLLESVPADKASRYTLGALVLQSLHEAGQLRDASQLATKLADDFAANEKKLDPKASGAALAPAVIYFVKAECARASGDYADALADYETVLAAYPYNEWPDAAACGAAECYATLGDTATALAKFKEVAGAPATNPPSPASEKWRAIAKRRIEEIEKK